MRAELRQSKSTLKEAVDVPVSWMPLAIGARGHVSLCVFLVPDVHVALKRLPAQYAIPVVHFDLR